MAEHKHVKRSRRCKTNGRKMMLMLSIGLILSFAVSGTLAYIATETSTVENQFAPAYVTCRVNVNNDTIDVTNTGNVDAYIRAAIVVNWMNSSGDVRGIAPTAGEYTLGIGTGNGWERKSDGYYYYTSVVTPEESSNDTTEDLVTSIAVNVTPPTGYELSVEVVAEAIQADGVKDGTTTKAYADAWGINGLGN